MTKYSINLCENNEQGNPTGMTNIISLSVGNDQAAYLETMDAEPEPVKNLFACLVMYGAKISYKSMTEMAGNVFWNAYELAPGQFLAFANLLRRSGKWRLTDGWQEVWDRWEKGEELTAKDFDMAEDPPPVSTDQNQLGLF